ncbi:Vesicle-associated protein 1-2 [Raphanus sativus]|nr:Vesicle-associated protein 1-2 [Raphanus sativus]
MQAQKEVPADMQCKDKFLFQCFVASPGSIATEITTEMFSQEAGHRVEETKLRVVYVDPPLLRSPEQLKRGSNRNQSGGGILIRMRWYISARGLRRRTVKGGEVAIHG